MSGFAFIFCVFVTTDVATRLLIQMLYNIRFGHYPDEADFHLLNNVGGLSEYGEKLAQIEIEKHTAKLIEEGYITKDFELTEKGHQERFERRCDLRCEPVSWLQFDESYQEYRRWVDRDKKT